MPLKFAATPLRENVVLALILTLMAIDLTPTVKTVNPVSLWVIFPFRLVAGNADREVVVFGVVCAIVGREKTRTTKTRNDTRRKFFMTLILLSRLRRST